MTLVAVALAVVLLAVAVGAGEAFRRSLRASERREQRLEGLLKQQQAHEVEVLDRVMFVAGKPWKDTADRPDPEEPDDLFPDFDRVEENPVPGGAYPGDALFDDLDDDLRSDAGDTVFVPERFDTRELEVT